MKVIPLRYGTIFKKAFRDPEVFSGFARAVLGIPHRHRGGSPGVQLPDRGGAGEGGLRPLRRGHRATRDRRAAALLTTAPRDRELQFSVAVSDMDPVGERGAKVDVCRHRLVFLNPKLIDAQTPAGARSWLELIADLLDGEVDASRYHDPLPQRVLHAEAG